MSDKVIGPGRAARAADFAQRVKEHEEYWDKVWAADRERTRLLDEGDRKYYEDLEARSRAALKKHLQDVGSSQTGAPAGQVLK